MECFRRRIDLDVQIAQGVKFHDGTPFNADAVVFNFTRIVDPATKSEYAIFVLGPYDSSRAVDDSTIELKMTRTYSALIPGLSTHGMSMVSPAAVQKYGQDFAQHPVGTGPFIFKECIQKDHLMIKRTPTTTGHPAVRPTRARHISMR